VVDPRPRGVFRLGSMESTAAVRLPQPLNEFHRRHPDVVLELRIGNPEVLAKAILAGELDAAFVWGPQAGWYAQRAARPLKLHYLSPPATLPGQPFSFAIAMGVKHGNVELRDRLDELLVRRRADIARILDDYGVPRTEEKAP